MSADVVIDRHGDVVPQHNAAPDLVLMPEDGLPAAFDGLALIAVRFPKFRDGRGFSQIRALRERGCLGEIRAVGNVLPDQFLSLVRCGVSTVALPEGADPAVWRAVLGLHVGDEAQALPLLRRIAVPFEV